MRREARPLPECRLCESPTRREAWLRHGGLCSSCVEALGDTVRMPRYLPPVPEDDRTVVVEGYRPPVPGQLRIDEGE